MQVTKNDYLGKQANTVFHLLKEFGEKFGVFTSLEELKENNKTPELKTNYYVGINATFMDGGQSEYAYQLQYFNEEGKPFENINTRIVCFPTHIHYGEDRFIGWLLGAIDANWHSSFKNPYRNAVQPITQKEVEENKNKKYFERYDKLRDWVEELYLWKNNVVVENAEKLILPQVKNDKHIGYPKGYKENELMQVLNSSELRFITADRFLGKKYVVEWLETENGIVVTRAECVYWNEKED